MEIPKIIFMTSPYQKRYKNKNIIISHWILDIVQNRKPLYLFKFILVSHFRQYLKCEIRGKPVKYVTFMFDFAF